MKKKHATEAVPSSPRSETIRIANLVPHPEQGDFFKYYERPVYDALKADIAVHGVLQQPHVTPPGNAAGYPGYMHLTGHTRCKILAELGHKEVNVLVRYDLLNATKPVFDDLFLKDNAARRQMSRLAQARVAIRRFQIEREKKGRKVYGDPLCEGELRDRLGAIVDMSGRNFQRYLNLLSAPVEVQDAFEAGRVKLVDAARVFNLPKDEQMRLAARLRAGEDAKAVFAEYFPPADGKHVKLVDAVAAFARALKAAGADLAGRADTAKPKLVQRHADALREGKKLIHTLLGKMNVDE